MMLLTKANREALPALGTQDGAGFDAVAYVKFFGSGRWTWYATEFDGDDTFFGYVISGIDPDFDEWGYFSLSELTEARFPPFNLPTERDRHWDPKPLREELKTRWAVTV